LTPYSLLAAEPGTGSTTTGEPPGIDQRILDFLKPAPVQGDELRRKLAERHNAAVDLLEARADAYKKGVHDINPVLDAARLVVDAKLDLAENEQARERVLQDTLALAQLIEDRTQELLKKGIGSKADYQRARLGRLTVEVQILKAKQVRKP
jgi:outer membrane protein TolC